MFDDYKIINDQQSPNQLAQLQKIDLSKVNNAIKDNLIIWNLKKRLILLLKQATKSIKTLNIRCSLKGSRKKQLI